MILEVTVTKKSEQQSGSVTQSMSYYSRLSQIMIKHNGTMVRSFPNYVFTIHTDHIGAFVAECQATMPMVDRILVSNLPNSDEQLPAPKDNDPYLVVVKKIDEKPHAASFYVHLNR